MKRPSPEELASIGCRLYGRRHWITRMSEALGVNGSTVWRWAHGKIPLPPVAARLIRELDAKHRANRASERALRP